MRKVRRLRRLDIQTLRRLKLVKRASSNHRLDCSWNLLKIIQTASARMHGTEASWHWINLEDFQL